jgi:hypothetical protein
MRRRSQWRQATATDIDIAIDICVFSYLLRQSVTLQVCSRTPLFQPHSKQVSRQQRGFHLTGQNLALQVRSQELVAVCDRCLQPVDEATFNSNMQRLEVRCLYFCVTAAVPVCDGFCCRDMLTSMLN